VRSLEKTAHLNVSILFANKSDRLRVGRLPRDYILERWRGHGFATDLMCLMCSGDLRAIHVQQCWLQLWDDERRVGRSAPVFAIGRMRPASAAGWL
jgi:hypothetical protein